MVRKILIILFISYTLKSQDYINPMKIDQSVSGSFGELRSNHFHSGIDFRTFGKTNIKIYSIEDGYVSRVKVQVAGYGKAIYISHPKTGQTSVYAHLNGFNRKLEEIVKEKQYKRKSYTVDMVFKPEEIKIKKGDIIAYSGNTGGSSGPHLHFEIRDTKTQYPLNPAKNGFEIKDNIPPIIRGICIIPIKEKYELKDYYNKNNFFKDKKGNYITRYMSDKFGIGVNAIDKINNSRSNNGVYSICLKMNGDSIFYRKMDFFSFKKTRYINNLLLYGESIRRKINIEKCFIPKANRNIDIYNSSINNGIISPVKNKVYNMELILADENNNVRIEKFKIIGKEHKYINNNNLEGENNIFFIDRSKKESYNKDNLILEFPKECLYEDTYLEIKKIDNIYSIGNKKIPVHKKYSFKIKDTISSKNKNNFFISYKSKNNSWVYIDTKYKDGYFVSTPTFFGDFKINIDTIPPKIRIINRKITKRTKYLKIVSKDNKTGIKKFNAHINGEWVLFEYDYKQNLFKFNFDDKKNLKGNLNLEVEVEDYCGNISNYSKLIKK